MSFKMTFNGQPFDSKAFAKKLEKDVATVAKRKISDLLAEKFRDPVTGEKPIVSISGNIEKISDLDGMTAKIKGSGEIVAQVADQIAE